MTDRELLELATTPGRGPRTRSARGLHGTTTLTFASVLRLTHITTANGSHLEQSAKGGNDE